MTERIAIIGGGLSGLGTAYYLHQGAPDARITVFEAAPRTGGKIQTSRGEFTCESGPNGFLDSRPEIVQLSHELGLTATLLPANANSARRFIYSSARLNEIHAHPLKFMASPLLSPLGKLRLCLEHFAPKPRAEDETLEEFGCRKLGREAFERLIDPMASGVYAGNPAHMSVRSCFPRIYQMERQYGSLTRALFAIKKEKKQQGETSSGPAGPAGLLTSFKGGLYEMIEALQEQCGATIRTNCPVLNLTCSQDSQWEVWTSAGKETFDAVVCATPAWDSADILHSGFAELAGKLRAIQSSPISVVALAYDTPSLSGVDTNGFGFLVPGREGRKLLGSLWSSSIFQHRAPAGTFLTQCMVGGARQPELALLDDDALVQLVRDELRITMGIAAEPIYRKIFRWDAGIPQYNMGHSQILSDIEELRRHTPRLYFTGNSYRGISVNDCVVDARSISELLLREGRTP
ncbi:protoporphyrinogen oxidase [Desulfurispirillum indicum]|uniref:Coproporphyrinogen III oxidase n=1 Tax=Desulfurispirillum indicum (strain ATCC BAA-1389 / DSM 22839 / S5) TaxID=653733 RepID=E6W257_DESIS|nr:protoporphyrinogen oxidase [Desulfurispirillum indicum]ADU65515.1 protoporphyrinogen oxidase [Desulfurispirillum indicum S5]UCZ57433.1 protoporphyrinogen oxidase [Desulfurispirillum indicum]